MDPAERPANLAGQRAARGDRHHLREPPERDRRCRRARAQIRQRRDPARRLGELSFLARAGRGAARRAARRRPAGGRDPAGADPRPRGGRHDADDERRHRHHRAARRRLADRAGAAREPHPGHRPSRRAVPHLYRRAPPTRKRRARSCSTPRCGGCRSAARPRHCWSIAPSPRTMLPPILADLREAGCELRGDPEVRAIDPAAVPATEAGLAHRISRRDPGGARRRRRRRRRSRISSATARTIPTRS